MTAPGLPFLFRQRRRDPPAFDDLVFREDEDEDLDFAPLILGPDRRPMTLSEIGNADIVGRERPGFGSRLLDALSVAGAEFQPIPSRGFFPNLLQSAFQSFGRSRLSRQDREAEAADIEREIMQGILEQRQATEDRALDEEKTRAEIDALSALATQRRARTLEDMEGDEDGIDVTGTVAELRARGMGPVADLLTQDPEMVRRAPGTLMRLLTGQDEEDDEGEERQTERRIRDAVERATRADEFAARALEGRRDQFGGLPEGQTEDAVLGALRRQFDPSFVQDSIIRAQELGTVSGTPSPSPPPISAPPEELAKIGAALQRYKVGVQERIDARQAVADTTPTEAERQEPAAYIRRLKAEGKSADEIRRLARQHGLVQ